MACTWLYLRSPGNFFRGGLTAGVYLDQRATPEQAQEAHAFIRGWVAKHRGEKAAARLPILYGGSVKATGSEEAAAAVRALASQPDIDGGLIGGAGLVPDDFLRIVAIVHEVG